MCLSPLRITAADQCGLERRGGQRREIISPNGRFGEQGMMDETRWSALGGNAEVTEIHHVGTNPQEIMEKFKKIVSLLRKFQILIS